MLCGIDYSYINRLERNEKFAPSEDVVEAFIRTLKLTSRNAKLLRLLVGESVNPKLIDVFIEDEDRPVELFMPLARMSFRGKRPATHNDWRSKADLLEEFLEN